MPSGTPIVFPTVVLNDGNGYNATSGVFTAPISGVYTFTSHVCNGKTKYMVMAIMKGSDQLARSSVYDDSGSTCGSVDTIVRLQAGNAVNVVAKYGESKIWADVNRVNSFTGFFLYQ